MAKRSNKDKTSYFQSFFPFAKENFAQACGY